MSGGLLIFFDYSGTLCFDSVRFGAPETLTEELVSSGLYRLGVRDTDFFWERVINPSWVEGSTTGIGYGALMERRLKEVLPAPVREEDLRRAVRSFSGRYFGSFRVDPRWRETLCGLRTNPSASVLVVTDHYAEATDAVIGSLGVLGIEARAFSTAPGKLFEKPGEASFLVANSADLGCVKADRRFWELLQAPLSGRRDRPTILVDDFGCNEAGGSAYGEWPRVLERRRHTAVLVGEVFGSPPLVISFFPGDTAEPGKGGHESPGSLRSLEEVIRDVNTCTGPHVLSPAERSRILP